jgi:hypothetical protein
MDTLLLVSTLLSVHTSNVPAKYDSAYAAIMARPAVVKLITLDEAASITTREEIQANVPEGSGATVSYIDHQ